jgi:hypothetical protein
MAQARNAFALRHVVVAVGYGATCAVLSLAAGGGAVALLPARTGLVQAAVFLAFAAVVGVLGMVWARRLADIVVRNSGSHPTASGEETTERRLRVVPEPDLGRR